MKKILACFMTLFFIFGTVSFSTALAAEGDEKWESSGVELTRLTPSETAPYSVRVENFASETEWEMTYSAPVNGKEGFEISYLATKFSFEKEAPYDNNYVEFRFMEDAENGIILRTYSRYAKEDSDIRKMMTYVRYMKDGSITTEECFETEKPMINNKHTVSARYEGGQYWFTFDGTAAIPCDAYNEIDLSAATVSVRVKSGVEGDIRFTDPSSTQVSVLYSGWSTFGVAQVSQNEDNTTKFKMDDPISDTSSGYYDGANRVRDNLVYYEGVDVREPIVIELSYDIKSVPAVWWGIVLSSDPYGNINRTLYDEETGEMDSVKHPGSAAIDESGIMFQTTSLAQNLQEDLQQDLKRYTSNAGVNGYESRSEIDTIEYRVGTESTSVYFNGELLWDNINLKQSDFKDYKAYPTLHFIETPASETKWNEINIKGVNAPDVETDDYIKQPINGTEDLTINVSHVQKGTETKLYTDKTLTEEISAENYSIGDNAVIISAEYLTSLGKGQYEFYLVTENGAEWIHVPVYDPSESLQAPETEKSTYFYLAGDTTANLEISLDVKNGSFKQMTGAGISSKYYTFTPGTNGSTVGTISIDKDWLAQQEAGETYKFTVVTENPLDENETQRTTFNVSFVYEIPDTKWPTPNAPNYEATSDSITVDKVDGAEYRINGGEWQDSNVFEGLEAGTEYTIEMRMKASDGLEASDPVSIQVKTQSASGGCSGVVTMPLLGAGMVLLAGAIVLTVFKRKKNYNK